MSEYFKHVNMKYSFKIEIRIYSTYVICTVYISELFWLEVKWSVVSMYSTKLYLIKKIYTIFFLWSPDQHIFDLRV